MTTTTQVSSIDDAPDTAPATSKDVGGKRKAKVDGFDIALSGKKKTITIHTSEAEGGHDAIPIGLNGYMYQVPRGIPVEVPEELVKILENAKVTTFHPSKEPGEFVARTSNRYAFSVH